MTVTNVVSKNQPSFNSTTNTRTSPVTLSCSFAELFGGRAANVIGRNMTRTGGYGSRKIASSVFMSWYSYGNAIEISMIDGHLAK